MIKIIRCLASHTIGVKNVLFKSKEYLINKTYKNKQLITMCMIC